MTDPTPVKFYASRAVIDANCRFAIVNLLE